MKIIELAREIGKEIQKEDCYLNLKKAEIAADKDKELQDAIGEFNLKRLAINEEAAKSDRDSEKMDKLNDEMRQIYAGIMENQNMQDYNNAKVELDKILARVSAIITQSAQGDDPETTDLHEGCTGSCGTCGGCH
ncbi:MAG: YlbF family regulator [Acutalibacteraceae bacterium]